MRISDWSSDVCSSDLKNFSIFLGPGGTYRLTPLYDVLTAQPSLDAGQIERNQFRLAMSIGKNRHYCIHEGLGRHFVQTGDAAGLPQKLLKDPIYSMIDTPAAVFPSFALSLSTYFTS